MADSPSISPPQFLPPPPPPHNNLRTSPHRMSIQVPQTIVTQCRNCKSLPNIVSTLNTKFETQPITTSNSTSHCAATQSDKKHTHHKPKILKKTWDKVKTIIHNPALGSSVRRESLKNKDKRSSSGACTSAPSTPIQKSTFDFEDGVVNDDDDERERIKRNYALLQKRLSEELHQRMNECGKSSESTARLPEHLSDEFKKRLQQWEMWKASTGKVHYTEEELQQIIPQEFSKKLLEWECIKHSHHVVGEELGNSSETNVNSCNKKSRKKKPSADQYRHHKELAWLEKQLEKIDSEKKRLEREMKKYLEREARLEKMKEALKNSPMTDVWIKTPTAKCRVEKITEKFAKKLYEWEEKQGIEPESSTIALLNPKYYETGEEERPPEEEEEQIDNDDNEVLGPLDLINARLEDAQETEQEKMVRKAMDDVAEALAEADGRISSAASSCCCSADYDDPTDSFATHEKNNSGASNTDSEFYKPEPRVRATRRRSSDAISTPLSDARSPSLSAFTSDDEGDTGLLKTVSEENDDTLLNNVVKDAESQTEIITRAKPVVVEEELHVNNPDQVECSVHNTGIFVQTKRTIFTPILDEVDSTTDKVVLIQEDELADDIKCPSPPRSIASISSPPSWKKLDLLNDTPPPKVVGAIPKRPTNLNLTKSDSETKSLYKPQPKTQLHRAFPKMGKIPVWCSPLVARRQFSSSENSPLQIPIITTPDDSSDFSIDKFLQDSKLLNAAINTPTDDSPSSSSFQLQPPKRTTSRLPKTNPLVPRKYTIGGGFPPTGTNIRTGTLLTRSNSFGYQRGLPDYAEEKTKSFRGGCSQGVLCSSASSRGGSQISLNTSVGDEEETHYQASVLLQHNEPCSSVSMHSVTKSKSTGSIKSKFGRALARSFGFGKSKCEQVERGAVVEGGGNVQAEEVPRTSDGVGSSIRRLGSWIPKVGSGGGAKND